MNESAEMSESLEVTESPEAAKESETSISSENNPFVQKENVPKRKLHLFRWIGLLLVVFLIVSSIVLSKKIETVFSVQQNGNGFYSMTYYEDCKTDKLMESQVSSIDDLISWLSKNQFLGLPLHFDSEHFGCCAFTAQTSEGDVLFGRNFDYKETDCLLINYRPKRGYRSVSMADLAVLGIGEQFGVSPMSLTGKLLMLAAPYVCVDGMNETGLGAAILELEMPETHQNQDKTDMLIYSAIRCILDTCASVDDAVALLSSFDMHTGLDCSYHVYITDHSKKSVVVEWLDGEMFVNEIPACTNTVLTPGVHYGEGDTDFRYDTIMNEIEGNDSILAEEDVKNLLSEVAQIRDSFETEWSCIYNLSARKVMIYTDMDFESSYSYDFYDIS